MTDPAARTDVLPGTWNAEITFIKGPRAGEVEPVELTFLLGGTLHADEPVHQPDGRYKWPQHGIGEWTLTDDRLVYWFYKVLADPDRRPSGVVYARGEGTVAPNEQTFTATGTGDVYGTGGELVVTNHTTVRATRTG